MEILLVSATPFEIAPLQERLELEWVPDGAYRFRKGSLSISLLITGVGLTQTAYAIGRLLGRQRFDLAINAGIAGAFNRKLALGDVVQVVTERFADLGVEEADGSFTDVHRLGLITPDQPPFRNGMLSNDGSSPFGFLPRANGLSVNRVHGYPSSIEQVLSRYPDADVESMEGAAFFYACLLAEIPFLEIRSISNYVEARNRANWRIDLAISELNKTLADLIEAMTAVSEA